MRSIILFGHESAAQEAFMHVDAMLRERAIVDVTLVLTIHVDQPTAKGLRAVGGELWYCGPTLTPPGGGWSPMCADKYLIGRTLEARTAQAIAAFHEFLRKQQVPA